MHNLHFQFHLCHQGALFNFDFTFPIYGQVAKKKTPLKFLVRGVITNLDEIWPHV